jgi:hypothetical protein
MTPIRRPISSHRVGTPTTLARCPTDRRREFRSMAFKSRPPTTGSPPSRASQPASQAWEPGIVGSYLTCEAIDPRHRSDAGHLRGLVVHLRRDLRVNRRSRSRGTEPSWVRPGRDRGARRASRDVRIDASHARDRSRGILACKLASSKWMVSGSQPGRRVSSASSPPAP